MHSRSNATGFSNRSQDWKSNTNILTEPETQAQVIDIDTMTREEKIKVDIVELIDHQDIQQHEDIIEELDYPASETRQMIQELKQEGVLQVTGESDE